MLFSFISVFMEGGGLLLPPWVGFGCPNPGAEDEAQTRDP